MLLLYIKFVVTIFSNSCFLCVVILPSSPSFSVDSFRPCRKSSHLKNSDNFTPSAVILFKKILCIEIL